MKFISTQSRRETILEALQQCRHRTLNLFKGIDFNTFCQQAHPDFSPVGWHLGHIAFTEAYWILEYCAEFSVVFPEYQQLFAADGLAKEERQNLPTLETIQDYLELVRSKVLHYLATAPVEKQERLWRWLIQHESQHSETVALVLQLHRWQANISPNPRSLITNLQSPEMIKVSAGEFVMGSDESFAQDNERPAHKRYLDTYWIDRYPVTCKQYREFMAVGGYHKDQYWSAEGWQWLENNSISQPLYWLDSSEWDNHPVYGVSYYEAEAYANFVGKRLPTEAEWEKAAKGINPVETFSEKSSQQDCNHDTLIGCTTPVNTYPKSKSDYSCYDMLGNVWEWTSSWFAPYPSFSSYPYEGYSQAYFDNQHRVLRGGSWATRPWALRASFRNWYHPWIRQIFAGFRCAVD